MHRHTRQTEIYNPQHYKPQTVILFGAGNVGSHVAMVLTKMGIQELHIVDFDTVEEHNLGSQAYTLNHIEQPKIEALQTQLIQLTKEITTLTFNGSAQSYLNDENNREFIKKNHGNIIIISAVDTLESRNEIAEILKTLPNIPLIDARMGQLQIEGHATMSHNWSNIIPTSVDDDPCGGKFISFTSYTIAGLIGNMVREIIKNGKTNSFIMNLHNHMIVTPSELICNNESRLQTTTD